MLVVMIQFLEVHPKRTRRWTIDLSEQKTNSSPFGDTTDFQNKKTHRGVNLERVKDKYAQIIGIFPSNLSEELSRQYFQQIGGMFHERSDYSQNLTASLQIQKSFRLEETQKDWQPESSLIFTIFASKHGEDRKPLSHLRQGQKILQER